MQVVSGSLAEPCVRFEAPAADRVQGEMEKFFEWMSAPSALDPVLRAAIAHFWFVTIHPLDDGNGRIARAIAGLALARVLRDARVWDLVNARSPNDRQRLVLSRMLGDWEGWLTTSEYATLAKCSSDTALRDVKELVGWGVLARNEAGGRSVSYRIAECHLEPRALAAAAIPVRASDAAPQSTGSEVLRRQVNDPRRVLTWNRRGGLCT